MRKFRAEPGKGVTASSDMVDVKRYLDQAVRNIANYKYNNCSLSLDDPRCDYFVENIVEDSTVASKKQELLDAIDSAVESIMRR